MKKQKVSGLSLNKKSISDLSKQTVHGGATLYCTFGCTDGCTIAQTAWNCTRGNCTADCTGGITWLCSALPGCVAGEE
ncbi:hypothetical protein KORDIASMS9_04457 [Kordia sp. SMS9]|uniref:class I lanthipeptide n=1 Tax=Kordia sp. SMS9 TaxID=2282170 RepID=UPI000E0D7A1F|nr:class I lanthipeptide [Kordia sp. SMS9]AXG72189.1 hypothetical protein KORDIASMS9_04457 [Kordia sp. SMS9]